MLTRVFCIALLTIFGAGIWLSTSAQGVRFDRDLFYGMENDAEITRLQEFLRDQGHYQGPITGSFFEFTRDGVKNFQDAHGITPSLGYFGPLTRAKANALMAQDAGNAGVNGGDEIALSQGDVRAGIPAGFAFARNLFFGLRSDPDVRHLQQFLGNLGYFQEEITGNFLFVTQEAVKEFQQFYNITPAAGYFGPLSRAKANELLGVSASALIPGKNDPAAQKDHLEMGFRSTEVLERILDGDISASDYNLIFEKRKEEFQWINEEIRKTKEDLRIAEEALQQSEGGVTSTTSTVPAAP